MSEGIWVKESPQVMALGEAIAWIFDFNKVGASAPTQALSTVAYDNIGNDVSGSVLSGSATLVGSLVTSARFAPAKAIQYVLVQPAMVDGNTTFLACRFDIMEARLS